MAKFIEIRETQLKLKTRVQPRSPRAQWGELINRERIQLKINAPPTDGKANKACVKFVAKQFGAAKISVSVIQGKKSRYKTFLVKNYKLDKLREFLKSHVG